MQQYSHIYASVEDVPSALLKSPLQRTIQLLKRQRDCHFDGKENEKHKPISIIITVLASRIARHTAVYHISLVELYELIVKELKRYAGLLGNDYTFILPRLHEGYILRNKEGWEILNPVNPEENLADKWHENDHARARAFFEWIASLDANFNKDVVALRLLKGLYYGGPSDSSAYCPCGSKISYVHCHKETVERLRNSRYRFLYFSDFRDIQEMIKRQKQD